jgi:hypothetical protein
VRGDFKFNNKPQRSENIFRISRELIVFSVFSVAHLITEYQTIMKE